jgi:hypothetical protein
MNESFTPNTDSLKPFIVTEPLRTSEIGRFSMLEQFRDNPNYVLKTVSSASRDIASQYSGESSIEATNHVLSLMQQSELGQFLPATHLVIGETEPGDTKLFMVSEKIVGQTLNRVSSLTDEISEDIDSLLEANTQYYIKSYDKDLGVGYTLDIFGFDTNVMIGKNIARADATDKVYFIDAFPIFRLTPDHLSEASISTISRLESRGLHLPRARAADSKLIAI